MLQRQELPPEYTIADLVKEFPLDKYDFDVFQANIPFSVYQNLVNTNARPRTGENYIK